MATPPLPEWSCPLCRRIRSGRTGAVVAGTALLALCAACAGREVAGEPVLVHVAIIILSVDDIDSIRQTFAANVYIEAHWRDPAGAEGPAGVRPLSEAWNPRLQLLNQRYATATLPQEVHVDSEGQIIYRQRYWGVFSQKMNFKRYPFDRQSLTITLVAAGYTPQEVRFVELTAPAGPPSRIIDDALPPDWRLVDFHVQPTSLTAAAEAPGVPALEVAATADRRWEQAAFKLFMPLCLIVAMSWVVFWIDPTRIDANATVAVTSVLTIIAYRFSVAESLSRIPYVTRLDAFVGVATVMVFLTVLQSVWSAKLAQRGPVERALRFDRRSRVVFPVLFILLALWALTLG